ncbi:MAG TPA: chloride channel protein [Chitinophagaceae bacterium]|nr:chloride channel protein [Chitinophagaceae bacterium]
MKGSTTIEKGIPISPLLDPIINADNDQSKKGESKRRMLTISFYSFLIAIATSVIAKFLVLLINLITNISFYGRVSLNHNSPADNTLGLFVILLPAIGGLIVGLMAYYGSKAIRGHGIPEAMEQILTNQSKIKPTITYLKPISSAISIGTGGPFGAEGPIIATGGALGSTLGQLIKISHYERKILLAAGATAGMSAIFGSPLAAIFLAVELLLFEFSSKSIIPVAIACITGAAGHHFLFDAGVTFPMPDFAFPDNSALAIYTGIGLLVGVISVGVSKAVYIIEEWFEKIPVHWMWWPAIGGLVVGVVGYFAPHTLGVGYDNISNLLSGNMGMQVILSLCIMKFISWAIALGSGTSGGTLAPLLTIGGATGSLIGLLIVQLFPGTEISIPLTALVGMAAMFAGASRALLTSIIFALETTMQSNALLPLMGACVASYIVSYFLMEHNIMTEKIARRGIKTPDSYRPNVLERFSVGQVFDKEPLLVQDMKSILEVKNWIKTQEIDETAECIMVIDKDEQYKGVINFTELLSITEENENNSIGSLIQQPFLINTNDSLLEAIELMAQHDSDILTVEANNSIVGILSLKNILAVYKIEMNDELKGRPHISLKRKLLKIAVRGRQFTSKK